MQESRKTRIRTQIGVVGIRVNAGEIGIALVGGLLQRIEGFLIVSRCGIDRTQER